MQMRRYALYFAISPQISRHHRIWKLYEEPVRLEISKIERRYGKVGQDQSRLNATSRTGKVPTPHHFCRSVSPLTHSLPSLSSSAHHFLNGVYKDTIRLPQLQADKAIDATRLFRLHAPRRSSPSCDCAKANPRRQAHPPERGALLQKQRRPQLPNPRRLPIPDPKPVRRSPPPRPRSQDPPLPHQTARKSYRQARSFRPPGRRQWRKHRIPRRAHGSAIRGPKAQG